VRDILSAISESGQKDFWAALVNILGIEPLIKLAGEGIAALYNNYRSDTHLTRKAIENQLEAARWPEFAKVQPAQ